MSKDGLSHEYKELSKALHYKGPGLQISVGDVKTIIEGIIKSHNFKGEFNGFNTTIDLYSFVVDVTDSLLFESLEPLDLEARIVFSIACRLVSERKMLEYIQSSDSTFKYPDGKNPTRKLFNKYKEIGGPHIRKFKFVLHISPETIHLNSFMYEPLIDMGIGELKGIYQSVSAL